MIPIGIYIRRHLQGTAAETPAAESSLRVILRDYRRTVVSGVLLVIGSTANYYPTLITLPAVSLVTTFLLVLITVPTLALVTELIGLARVNETAGQPLN